MNKTIYTSCLKYFLPKVLIALLLVTNTGTTQSTAKKVYTAELDSLWSQNTYLQKITPDGNWITYTEVFDNKENILTLKHTSKPIAHTFKDCNIVNFSKNSRWFGGITGNQELVLIDLVKNTKEVYPDILLRSFYFSKSGDYVAAYEKGDGTSNALLVVNLSTGGVSKIPGVTDYQWHPVANSLLMVKEQDGQRGVMLYDAENGKSIDLAENRESDYRSLKWSDSGNAVFIEQQQDTNTLHYLSSDGTLRSLDDRAITTLGGGYRVSDRPVFISDDGKKVLFYRKLINEEEEAITPTVEVWDTEDPWIYPRMQYYKETELRYLLTVWYPDTDEVVAIETEALPTAALDINHDYALVFNQLDYEPQYKFYPNADLYIKNMKTGKTRLVTKNQYTEGKFITISPNGKYISYFKDNNWWVYNIRKDKTVNLTHNVSVNFQNTEMERAGDVYPYSNPGWLGKDEHIVLYDQYDVWMMTPDGREKRRITKGREENIRYRISREITRNDFFKITINQNFASVPFNTKKGLLLEMFDNDDYKTGFALLQKNNSVKTVVLEDLKLSSVLGAKDLSTIVYSKQKFDKPIGIYSLNLQTKEEQLIYQSNKELMSYDLGKAELIEFNSPKGKPLKGTLMYPADYDPGRKYPMIVLIYERESKEILKFLAPGSFDYRGFSRLTYTTDGYFVFYPDFTYTIGDPGISALKCLISGVEKVLETGMVDKDRVGLIGHSFGGYETAFIVTQTDMFAAAVAGAALTDVVNYYHSVFWGMKMNQLWRMENQQWRMGTSFYNNKEGYYRNSPLQHIENVNTPLLLWTGKLDTNVNWTQSVNMFMGLKRLNKKAKMLLFDKEPHNIMQKENQRILSQEIFDWMETNVKKNG